MSYHQASGLEWQGIGYGSNRFGLGRTAGSEPGEEDDDDWGVRRLRAVRSMRRSPARYRARAPMVRAFGLGATPTSTPTDLAMSIARDAAMASPANFVVVFIDRNGSVAKVKTYGSRSEMNADWDSNIFNKLPNDIALAMSMDKVNTIDGEPLVDQTVNPLIKSKINWKSAAPFIIGGAALIALAIYMRKGKPGKPRARRSTPAWRRKVITVWR